jgi:hypothetical protein
VSTTLCRALVEDFRLDVPVIKKEEIYIAHAGATLTDKKLNLRR